jgi:hypothetical protein
MIWKSVVPCLLAGILPGCSGGSGGGGTPATSAFLGVYEITSWIEIEGSCDGEAVSVLEQRTQYDPYVLIDACSINFFGVSDSWIQLIQCSDETNCNEQRCEDNEFNIGMGGLGTMTDGNDASGWTNNDTGYSNFPGADDNECIIKVDDPMLFQDAEGLLTLEKRTFSGTFEPINGSCMSTKFEDGEFVDKFDSELLFPIAEDTKKNGDCSNLTVITFEPLNATE